MRSQAPLVSYLDHHEKCFSASCESLGTRHYKASLPSFSRTSGTCTREVVEKYGGANIISERHGAFSTLECLVRALQSVTPSS